MRCTHGALPKALCATLLGVACCSFEADAVADAPQQAEAHSEQLHSPTDPDGRGPELSLRSGYAVPRGPLNEEQSLGEVVALALPLWLNLGYRLDDWFIGGYAQAALGVNGKTIDTDCPDCSSTWLRLGLEVQYRFYDRGDHALWFGVSSGRQWLNTTIDSDRRESKSSRGWELIGLGLGSTIGLADGVTIGPFSAFSLGKFDLAVSTCAEDRLCSKEESRVETDLSDLNFHTWFISGIRISILP